MDGIESLLKQALPEPVSRATRKRVLGAVNRELRSRRKRFRPWLAAAASVLIGVFANIASFRVDVARQEGGMPGASEVQLAGKPSSTSPQRAMEIQQQIIMLLAQSDGRDQQDAIDRLMRQL